ncbi:hypothetical protein ATY78_08855 [Rhizobium sp. R635]|nr:hypothetical protein ATY78_08855 [Rhizobium sp. R635]
MGELDGSPIAKGFKVLLDVRQRFSLPHFHFCGIGCAEREPNALSARCDLEVYLPIGERNDQAAAYQAVAQIGGGNAFNKVRIGRALGSHWADKP